MDNLPNEMYVKITNCLPLEAKKLMRSLSHRWRSIIDDWVIFNVELNDMNYKYVQNFNGIIHKLTVGRLTESKLTPVLNPIHSLIFTNSDSNFNINFLILNNEIEHLYFQSRSIPSIPHHISCCLHLPNLAALTILIEDLWDLQKALALTTLDMSSLSKVELQASNLYIVATHVDSYLGFYKFLGQIKSKNLRSVSLGHFQRSLKLNHSLYPDCIAQARKLKNVDNIKLEEVSLSFSDLEDFENKTNGLFSLGIHFLNCQRTLTTLTLQLVNHKITEMSDPINQVILQNSFTLKKLHIYSSTTLQILYNFYCPSIQNCTNLEELKLTRFVFQIEHLKFPPKLTKLSLSGWASFQSDFEILKWITKNCVFLKQIDIHFNWNHYMITTSGQLSCLSQLISMPHLKTIVFLNSTAAVFKSFFQMRSNVIVKRFETINSPHDPYPRLVEALEVTFKGK